MLTSGTDINHQVQVLLLHYQGDHRLCSLHKQQRY